jgi:hypothetical protein
MIVTSGMQPPRASKKLQSDGTAGATSLGVPTKLYRRSRFDTGHQIYISIQMLRTSGS